MSLDDLDSMMIEAAALLNARVLESSSATCQLDMEGRRTKLTIVEGPAGCHINGKIELAHLVVEESGTDILYAMYMNSTLHESFGIPVWFGMDAEDNQLLACFSISTADLTASKLAEALKPLEEIHRLDFAI